MSNQSNQKVNLEPRQNELGYQMVSTELLEYLKMSRELPSIEKPDQWAIKSQISGFGEKYKFPPTVFEYPKISMDLPQLIGSIKEHVDNLTEAMWAPYRDRIDAFLSKGIPEMPPFFHQNSGWTRYYRKPVDGDVDPYSFDFDLENDGWDDEWEVSQVPHPTENELVFDVETFVNSGNTAVMAVAVSNEAWYLWLHPCLVNPNQDYKPMMVSIGTDKLIVNHNVKFDTARIEETYDKTLATVVDFDGSPRSNVYLDTMSLHIAVCGMSSKQRDVFRMSQKGTFTPAWSKVTSMNNLVDVYNHHVQPLERLSSKDKATRELFVTATDHRQFVENLTALVGYTLKDGLYTYGLAQSLWPKYKRSQPSIATLGGHLMLSQSFLPVTPNWHQHIGAIEIAHAKTSNALTKELTLIGQKLAKDFQSGELTMDQIEDNPWYSQLDWTPAKTGPTKGLPQWWRKNKSKGITAKGRLAPTLLKMAWNVGTEEKPDLSPLVYHSKFGWIFKTPKGYPLSFMLDYGVPHLDERHFGPGWYAKVPHKKGDQNNVGSPLGKDYIDAINQGLLCSPNKRAQEILKEAKSIAYWTSMRSRAKDYFTLPLKINQAPGQPQSLMVEPALVVHGTSSRRCVERLWLTVSGAKPDVIGSELKGLVQPPAGWVMVGADFDAQELKIGSAFSDAFSYQIHGSTAMGYTQLLGDKSRKTDGHSLLADFIKLSRNIAKNLNFQMLYLSGTSGCAMTIKSQRPELPEATCKAIANQALVLRRGKKQRHTNGNYSYAGGTDSSAYNFMLRLANNRTMPPHLKYLSIDNNPRTPALGSSMSLAIQERFCGGDYLTSRANWGIQSSGVDILHIFLSCLYYLRAHYKLDFQFMFTYHDEIWAISPEAQKYQTALCFQVAHLWTWAYFFESLGFKDLPYNYMFFSGVNIDFCFRKETGDSQVTPSNPEPGLPDGETLDIYQLLERLNSQTT
jgi:DNA polymerase gamma 1